MTNEVIKKDVCKIAMTFAWMWGIMETLKEDFPRLDEKENTMTGQNNIECLLSWAEEYIATEQEDITEFFEVKMKKYIS